MINLKCDPNDSFEEYKKAINRKSNSKAKDELLSIEKPMQDCYTNYRSHYKRNNLEYMPKTCVGVKHKNVLLSLYGSDVSLVKNFRMRFFSLNPQTYNNLCPYCTINEANTTEHILPKEKYPEFAVHTLNLIPACSACNSKKGDIVIDALSNKKIAINYYTDILPDVQYLFVDFTVKGSNIMATYNLRNLGEIDSDLFSLIERHFKRFDLLNRFNTKILQDLSELKNLYISEGISNPDEFDLFAAKQIKKINMDRKQLGFNHWKVILYYSAATSEVFKNYILRKQ